MYVCYRIIFLLCATYLFRPTEGETENRYTIQHFQHSPGVYYEKQGTLLYTSKKWKLAIKLDISLFKQRLQQTKQIIKLTNHLCSQVHENNNATCSNIYNEISNKKDTIEKLYSRLTALIDNPTRKRRGLVDGLGTLAKTLFGTMDASDEKLISEHLKSLDTKQTAEQHILNSELQVVNATIAHLSEVESVIQRNENTLSKTIDQVLEALNKQTQEKEINSYFIVATTMLNELENDIKDILELLTNTYSKFSQLEIIPVEQIIHNMKQASDSLPQDLHFPFAVKLNNWLQIKNFMTITVYCKGTYVFTVIQLPLVNSVHYDVLRVILLPTHNHANVFTVAQVSSSLIAVDNNRHMYSLFTEHELSKCNTIQTYFVCSNPPALYKIQAQSPCEIQAYIHELNNYLNCQTTSIKSNHTIWIKLKKPGTWLYSTLTEQSVTIKCENNAEAVEKINGTGKLTLIDSCKLSTTDVVINTNTIITNPDIDTYLPRFNLSALHIAVHTPLVKNTLQIENLTQHTGNLQQLHTKLNNIQDEVNREFYKQNYFIYPTSTSGLILLLVVITVLYILWRRKKQRKEKTSHPRVSFADEINRIGIPHVSTNTDRNRKTHTRWGTGTLL